jgi:hypothetical protein
MNFFIVIPFFLNYLANDLPKQNKTEKERVINKVYIHTLEKVPTCFD